MLAELFRKIQESAEVLRFTIDSRPYTDKAVHPVKEPVPDPLSVNTLTGFVDFFKECEADRGKDAIVHVQSPDHVVLWSPLVGTFCQRKVFAVAKAAPSGFDFGKFHDLEWFIIALQSRFVDTEDAGKILKVVGNLTDNEVHTYTDDGVSQCVVAKAGIVKVDNVPVPRLVKLAPYRTFLEIEQPKSPFLFRMRRGSRDGEPPSCALFEADGGKWKNEAIKGVKAYLAKALPKDTVILA
jgi:hypothetical protein